MEKNLSSVIGQVTAKAFEQKSKEQQKNLPHTARFKLVFIYKNGSYSPPYHSYDRHGKATDERLGLVKLIQLVHKRRGQFVAASIFASLEDVPKCRTEDGKLNKIYNMLVYREVLGKQPQYSSALKFEEGRMVR